MSAEDGKQDLKVEKIRYGVVIDGLLPSSSMRALKLLGINCDMPDEPCRYIVIPLMNVRSQKLGRKKDVLKIEVENPEEMQGLIKLVEANSGNLALISQQITINKIEDWKVAHKYKPVVPDELVGIINCPRYNCVTHEPKQQGSNDHYEPKFYVLNRKPLTLKCHYCPTTLTNSQIIENLVLK